MILDDLIALTPAAFQQKSLDASLWFAKELARLRVIGNTIQEDLQSMLDLRQPTILEKIKNYILNHLKQLVSEQFLWALDQYFSLVLLDLILLDLEQLLVPALLQYPLSHCISKTTI